MLKCVIATPGETFRISRIQFWKQTISCLALKLVDVIINTLLYYRVIHGFGNTLAKFNYLCQNKIFFHIIFYSDNKIY